MSKRVFTQPFAVVAAIIERGGKFLLVKENSPSHPDHGKWNQPAGWIGVGENPVEAVKREANEETGYDFIPTHLLSVNSLVRLDQTVSFGTTPHAIKLVFAGTISKKPISRVEDDISETRWFSPKEICAMDKKTLRDADIKNEIRDYLAGKRYPLEIITHRVQE